MTQPWGPPPGQRPPSAGHRPPPPGWGHHTPTGWGGTPAQHPSARYTSAPPQRPPAPGWNQPGPGGFQAPRPPQRNPLKTVFLAMTALAVVAVIALVAINVVGIGGSSEQAYENEQYQVPAESDSPPPLPDYPTDYDGAYAALEDNPLYGQTIPVPIRCELPPGDPAEMDRDQLDAYFTEEMACLTRAWQPPLNAAGYTEVRPPVTVYRDQVTSGCGSLEGDEAVNAFYCPADQAVYFSTLMFEVLPDLREPNIAALVMAHEYGHNVQARTNLMIPVRLLQSNIDDEDTQLELSRRLEVQADCFAGSFFNSTTQSLQLDDADFAAMEQALVNIGDDSLSGDPDIVGNHGHGDSRRLWGERGWTSADLAVCNTFTAPGSEVE